MGEAIPPAELPSLNVTEWSARPKRRRCSPAGWSRWLDELLEDAQAHEGDVFNNHRRLDVHCHQEEAES